VNSKEAALIDPGGQIDSLEIIINEQKLDLKYIFITHCHCDHIFGIPDIKKKYPNVKICFSAEEYEDSKIYSQWEKILDPAEVAAVKKLPENVKMLNFDYELLGKPDVFIKGGQIYKLGDLEIRLFLSPGHSRGSICFYAGNVLFSGDVLLYRRVGRTGFPQSGGPKEIIRSVRKLYAFLPDETKVYPGHDRFTDIGTEKKENEEVSVKTINIQN
jgi:glyoxylase-like metal-dependent hydrolase (beta-lactamase superfamily II)